MPPRWIHFVGSAPRDHNRRTDVPQEVIRRAVNWMVEVAQGNVQSLPDGETERVRDFWVQGTLGRLHRMPGVELMVAADWSKNRPPRYKKPFGRKLSTQAVKEALGLEIFARSGLNAMEGLLPARTVFQMGIPSPIVWAMAFRPRWLRLPRYQQVFRRATAEAINSIRAMAGDQVMFQLELPMEVLLLTKAWRLPLSMQRFVARALARKIMALVRLTKPGTRYIAHLCWGDFNEEAHKSLAHAGTLAPLVLLANALQRTWPQGYELVAIHLPLASGDQPAPTHAEFYGPLQGLEARSPLIAGVAHPSAPLQDQAAALRLAEQYAHHTFAGIAAPCGLGRVDWYTAEATMHNAVALAQMYFPR